MLECVLCSFSHISLRRELSSIPLRYLYSPCLKNSKREEKSLVFEITSHELLIVLAFVIIFDFSPKINGCEIRTSLSISKGLNFMLWIGYSKSFAKSSYSYSFNPSGNVVSLFNFIENYGNTRDFPFSIGVNSPGERSDEANSLHNSSKNS